jgi:transcriptional regulator with AAA-type ATPase domain
MAQSLQQLHAQIEAMPSDLVKEIVLSWLTNFKGNLGEFERLIAETAPQSEEYQWGEINTAQEFQLLSEEQMIAESLAALQDYQTLKRGISHQEVKQWADSLGSEGELPCPK